MVLLQGWDAQLRAELESAQSVEIDVGVVFGYKVVQRWLQSITSTATMFCSTVSVIVPQTDESAGQERSGCKIQYSQLQANHFGICVYLALLFIALLPQLSIGTCFKTLNDTSTTQTTTA